MFPSRKKWIFNQVGTGIILGGGVSCPEDHSPLCVRRGGAVSWSVEAGGRGVTTPPVLMRYRNMDMQNMDL